MDIDALRADPIGKPVRPRNKLNADKVREIIRRHAAGETYRAIAREVGCSSSNVLLICKGRIWREITKIRYCKTTPRLFGVDHPKAKLTENDVRSILRRRQTGITYRDLARENNVEIMTIVSICLGRTWRHVTGLERTPKRYSRKPKAPTV